MLTYGTLSSPTAMFKLIPCGYVPALAMPSTCSVLCHRFDCMVVNAVYYYALKSTHWSKLRLDFKILLFQSTAGTHHGTASKEYSTEQRKGSSSSTRNLSYTQSHTRRKHK